MTKSGHLGNNEIWRIIQFAWSAADVPEVTFAGHVFEHDRHTHGMTYED